MFNLDPAKLLVILVIALVVLGPERLPKVARQLGGVWRELNRVRDQVTDEVRKAIPDVDLPTIPNPSRSIGTFLNSLNEPPSDQRQESREAADGEGDSHNPDEPVRRPPKIVVHPSLGDFAFVPDDPSMN